MKQLDLEFLNAAGKTQHLKLKYAKQDLDEGTVRLAMEKMIDTKLFQKEGQLLYVTPKRPNTWKPCMNQFSMTANFRK